jgi:hypothetical protein
MKMETMVTTVPVQKGPKREQSDFDVFALDDSTQQSKVNSNSAKSLCDSVPKFLDAAMLPSCLSHEEEGARVLFYPEFPHHIIEANSCFSDLFGFRNGELPGKTMRLLIGPSTDLKSLKGLLDTIISDPAAIKDCSEQKFVFYRKNGDEIERRFRGTAQILEGRVHCKLELAPSFNEQVISQPEAFDDQQKAAEDRASLHIAPFPPHRILAATPAFLQASGFPHDHLLHRTIRLLCGPASRLPDIRTLPSPSQKDPTGLPGRGAARQTHQAIVLYRRDGEPLPCTARRVPLDDSDAALAAAAAAEAAAAGFDAPPRYFIAIDAAAPAAAPAAAAIIAGHTMVQAIVKPPSPTPPAIIVSRASAPPPAAAHDAVARPDGRPAGGIDPWVLLHMRAARRAGRSSARRTAAAAAESEPCLS